MVQCNIQGRHANKNSLSNKGALDSKKKHAAVEITSPQKDFICVWKQTRRSCSLPYTLSKLNATTTFFSQHFHSSAFDVIFFLSNMNQQKTRSEFKKILLVWSQKSITWLVLPEHEEMRKCRESQHEWSSRDQSTHIDIVKICLWRCFWCNC